MEKTKRTHIPSFGEWNYYNNQLPITQYFDSAMQAGDLFYVSSPVKPKTKQSNGCVEKQRKHVAIKPVDEDLYKIPSELLYQKPRRRGFLTGLLSGCLCLNCMA